MMSEVIRELLETNEVDIYSMAKAYAIKQVRNLKKNSKTLPLDLNEDEEEEEEEERPKKNTRFQ